MTKLRSIFIPVVAISAIAITVYITKTYFPQSETEHRQVITVQELIPSPDDAKQLVFENDRVIISVGQDQLTRYFNDEQSLPQFKQIVTPMAGTPDYSTYLDAKRKWKQDVESGFEKENIQTTHDDALVAFLLQYGIASVFDKQNKSFVNKITIIKYDFYCGPTCGQGGRDFYLPGILWFRGPVFLKVIDWVS